MTSVLPAALLLACTRFSSTGPSLSLSLKSPSPFPRQHWAANEAGRCFPRRWIKPSSPLNIQRAPTGPRLRRADSLWAMSYLLALSLDLISKRPPEICRGASANTAILRIFIFIMTRYHIDIEGELIFVFISCREVFDLCRWRSLLFILYFCLPFFFFIFTFHCLVLYKVMQSDHYIWSP